MRQAHRLPDTNDLDGDSMKRVTVAIAAVASVSEIGAAVGPIA
jgi:hypothetical protein